MTEPIKEGSALIHGANIHYRIYGNGPKTLLLLHGNGEDGHCFDKQIPDFSKHFQVITMDSRGHGLSERGPEPLTLDQMSIDAIELLKYLRVKSASVLGFSDGANIAMLMALKSVYPIEKLVLAGGNLYPMGVKPSCQLPTILGYGICSLIAKFDKKARIKAEILGLMVKEPRINPDSLGRITAPALILAGERDMIKDKHTKLIARSLPKSTLTIIPKASHFVFGKWAEQTNEVVLNFLRSDSKTVPGHHVSQ
ncbi:alpha/beta fold hydrolase [Murimonas intestini]|uniref:Pimeloyl-ACP methyl ester carboxylesterase n=1 Tax=Murimonas intestini TaxID=1337051 RepID=A0AB73T9H7_9FIRM|nr:alpha/beta hydrolase [Murimonas intestini]MCR1839248.1 alpha/beta hydrolase [Murimonas intestini]MCR1864544.1 alpha/beta hydrolase [Murimonas intestini]MCR1882154.1 alpha/beta hydrolase [Murimonas intestini]